MPLGEQGFVEVAGMPHSDEKPEPELTGLVAVFEERSGNHFREQNSTAGL
jgi:hypothetical protein